MIVYYRYYWSEQNVLIDIVSTVEQDLFIIPDYPILKHQMNIELWYMHVQIVRKTMKNQKCYQLKEVL